MAIYGLLLLLSNVKSYCWSLFCHWLIRKLDKFEFLQNGETQMKGFMRSHKFCEVHKRAAWNSLSLWVTGLSTNAPNWQYMALFPSLFTPYDFSKCEIVRGEKRIILQDCRLHWSSSFLMAQLKQSWQHWHSCIVGSLWKNPNTFAQ